MSEGGVMSEGVRWGGGAQANGFITGENRI